MIIAVLDSCVLYPPSLRDLLMRLATGGVYAPRWTEDIHDEWMRNVLKDKQFVSQAQLKRTRRLMDLVSPGCLVSGYEALIPALNLPDRDDRHVLAASIHAAASHIVTFNLSDFPEAALTSHHIRAVHPDDFLGALFDDDPGPFLLCVREHRASLKNPPKSVQDYLDTLKTNRLYWLARRIEAYGGLI